MKLERIEVDVTQEDIDESRHGAICSCPVANAIKRPLAPPEHIPRLDDPSVHMRDGFLTLHERNEAHRLVRTLYHFDLPPDAVDFVERWDAHEPVSPVKFNLDLTLVRIRDNITPSST